MDAEGTLQLGQVLTPLRDKGVLIVGSGSLTHNLYEFRSGKTDALYAQEFANWVAQKLAAREDDALVQYRARAPHAERAHPTEEHYLPILVAVGASSSKDSRTRIVGGMTYGVLSMDSFGFGLDVDALQGACSN